MALSKSYTCGVLQEQFTYTTFGELLDRCADEFPERRAHVLRREVGGSTRDDIVTFGELAARSQQLASALLHQGLRPGDRVAVIGQNCANWLYLEYALLRTKMLLVRVPSIYIGPDLTTSVLQRYGCKALVVHPGQDGDMLERLELILPGVVPESQSADKPSTVDHLFLMEPSSREGWTSVLSLDNLMATAPSHTTEIKAIQDSISPDDVAFVHPTSGSTGPPKYVTHTHFEYINAFLIGTDASTAPGSVYFNDRPFSWLGSIPCNAVISGMTMVHLEVGVSLEATYRAMEDFQGTSVFALPYLLYDSMQLHKSGRSLPKSLRCAATAGELVPKELIQYGIENIPEFVYGYGSTEAVHVALKTYRQSDDPTDTWLSPVPGLEMKIVRDNLVVAVGEVGDICIRGFMVTKQYLDDPKATAEVLDKAGWFSTGDVGKMDADGRVTVVGRKKDVISKGAIKIYPLPIERILSNHPGVDKVIVVPVSDPRLYHEICACVVPKPDHSLTVGDLEQYSKEHFDGSAAGMTPKYYKVLAELPRGSTGKVDRKMLVKMAEESFGRGNQ